MEVGFQVNHDADQKEDGFKVLVFVFMSGHAASIIEQPSKEAFHFPPSFIAPEFPSILCFLLPAVAFVRSNQFNAFFFALLIQRIRVIRFVPDELFRQLLDKTFLKGLLY